MHIPNRTYLWAYLTLEMIESDISINKAKIAEITSGIPEKVDQAYEKILSKSHDVEQAKKILHIIVAAVRPLALKEMNLALLLQQSHRSNNDFNLEPEDRFRQELRDICGLFITVINSKLYLLHQTAKEFLLQDTANSAARIHRSLTWKNSLNLLDSHHILSNICIWYLLNLEFEMNSRNGPGTSCLNTEDMIFLDYSSKHWATHFRELLIKTQKEKKESILKLCDTKSRRFQVWFEAYWASTNSKLPRGFTSLMAAAYFGLQTATQHLLEIKSDINRQDDTYQRTALCWAVRNGFKAVAELLIRGARYKHAFIKIPWRKKAKVDQVDKYGRTPLSYAVWNDSTAMVELLIKAGAQVRLKDELGGTPISYAICSQNEGVIDILVQKGNQADVEDDINYLLFSAAKKGHEEVIELLLKTGQVSPDARDQTSQTPLLYAAKESHKEIVKMLLMAGANPNSKDNHGQTPLMYSAHNGDEAAVRILLEGGADPNDRDKNGRTPLSRAAEKGHVAIVKVLLRRGAENYPMPLLYAADSGHEAAIRILLEQGADPNYTGHRQRTALSYAADSGHEAVTELLLEQGADTNYNDIDGRTALSYAATKGHEGIVKALLERGADPNYRDKDNRTPLSRAAEKGHAAIVKVLLERGVKDYSTSLLYAADNGHEAVVKVLLEDGADPNCKDLRRRTALSFAVGKGYDTIVDALLEGGAEPAHKEINYVHRASRSNTAPWPLRGRKLFPFLSKGEKAKTF